MSSSPQGIVTTDETNKTRCYAPSYLDFNNTFKGLNNISMVAKCKQLLLHKTRMWFGIDTEHPNIVYSTDIDNMYYVPTNAYYPPITNDADEINGLISLTIRLLYLRKKAYLLCMGLMKTTMNLEKSTSQWEL